MTTMTELAGGPPAPIPALPLTSRLLNVESLVIRDMLLDTITGAMAAHPRSLQKRIGPSEMGTPCVRKLTYKLGGTPERERPPAWRPTVGTAVHAWLAEQFVAANMAGWSDPSGSGLDPAAASALADLGPMTVLESDAGVGARPFQPPVLRYAVECTVDVGEVDGTAITGSCDLYDRVTATVVDWKIVGQATLKRVKANGPSDVYRRQAHLYGRGWTRRGVPCERVGIMFLPNSGELTEAVWWSEPWSEALALETLARADAVAAGIRTVGLAPMLAAAPMADDYCVSCPFFVRGSTDPSRGCPGVAAKAYVAPDADTFLMGAGA